jgi:hypothetical protein
VQHVVDLLRRQRVQRMTIIADHDAPHRRPDGSVWYPGRDGAQRLAAAVRIPWRIVMPPVKDLRAWVCAGATRVAFDLLAESATWRSP